MNSVFAREFAALCSRIHASFARQVKIHYRGRKRSRETHTHRKHSQRPASRIRAPIAAWYKCNKTLTSQFPVSLCFLAASWECRTTHTQRFYFLLGKEGRKEERRRRESLRFSQWFCNARRFRGLHVCTFALSFSACIQHSARWNILNSFSASIKLFVRLSYDTNSANPWIRHAEWNSF